MTTASGIVSITPVGIVAATYLRFDPKGRDLKSIENRPDLERGYTCGNQVGGALIYGAKTADREERIIIFNVVTNRVSFYDAAAATSDLPTEAQLLAAFELSEIEGYRLSIKQVYP